MKQLNKMLKSLWRGLGANLDETNAARVADSVEGLELILDSIDRDCARSGRQGYRRKGNTEQSVRQIAVDLMEKQVFERTIPRDGHPSLHNFNANLLHELDYISLHGWMTDLIKKWEAVSLK
jgi:hypothetical protein